MHIEEISDKFIQKGFEVVDSNNYIIRLQSNLFTAVIDNKEITIGSNNGEISFDILYSSDFTDELIDNFVNKYANIDTKEAYCNIVIEYLTNKINYANKNIARTQKYINDMELKLDEIGDAYKQMLMVKEHVDNLTVVKQILSTVLSLK